MSTDARSFEDRLDAWAVGHPHTAPMRVLLRAPTLLWRLGLGNALVHVRVRDGHLVMLTVRGRSTGRPRHAPVTAHEVGGRTYLWCPYADRSQWYRNAIADPVVTVQGPRGTHVMRAVGLSDPDEAIAVVEHLRRFDAAFLGSYLADQGVADTREQVRAQWQRLHLRRLEASDDEGPPPLAADLAWMWLLVAAAGLYRGGRPGPADAGGRPRRTEARRHLNHRCGRPAAGPRDPWVEGPEGAGPCDPCRSTRVTGRWTRHDAAPVTGSRPAG